MYIVIISEKRMVYWLSRIIEHITREENGETDWGRRGGSRERGIKRGRTYKLERERGEGGGDSLNGDCIEYLNN